MAQEQTKNLGQQTRQEGQVLLPRAHRYIEREGETDQQVGQTDHRDPKQCPGQRGAGQGEVEYRQDGADIGAGEGKSARRY